MNPSDLATELREDLGRVRLVVFDFDGVFTDNRVIVDSSGIESVICTRADGFGLTALRAAGIDSLVLSTEVNPVVAARCAKLGIRCVQGLEDKASALREELARLGVPAAQVVYVGNDVNDIGCLDEVGIPVAVADAYPIALERARLVTATAGGRGAVREVCDLIVACCGWEEASQ